MRLKSILLALLSALVFICCGGLGIAVYTNNSRASVLSKAYEAYLAALLDAQTRRDASHLTEVAVDPQLSLIVQGIEARKHFTEVAAEEFRNVQIAEIIKYDQAGAIIRVHYDYRPFAQSLSGGTRVYGPTGRWYWREEKVILENDGGIWKVKAVYFLDWSG